MVLAIKNLLANAGVARDKGSRPLDREDPLEEGTAAHSSILAWRIPMDRGAWWATLIGSQRVGHDSSGLARTHTHTHTHTHTRTHNMGGIAVTYTRPSGPRLPCCSES